MSTRDAEEEFEFLLNLLASDGAGPDPGQARGASGDKDDDRGVRVQRGSDGRLDLGQVKAFYESKNVRAGEGAGKGVGETRDPVPTDRPRNTPGSSTPLPAQTFRPRFAFDMRRSIPPDPIFMWGSGSFGCLIETLNYLLIIGKSQEDVKLVRARTRFSRHFIHLCGYRGSMNAGTHSLCV